MTYLDRNENNYGPAPACLEVLKAMDWEQLSWYSRDYLRGIKGILSERIAQMTGVPEKQVLLGYGAEDLLKQTVHCYLPEGGTLLTPTHSWWYYKSIADEKNGIRQEYPMLPGTDSYTYDVESFLRLIRDHKPSLILIASPNNPTGNCLPYDDLIRVLAAAHDTVIVLDEAYWGFADEPDGFVRDMLERSPDIIIMRTFSKLYALAGARIGYAFLGKNLDRLSRFSARYLGYNRVSEQLALAALDSTDWYDQIRANMQLDRQRYYDEIGTLPGFRAYRSDANFLLVDIPEQLKDTLKKGLKARELSVKFFDEQYLENSIRITIGTREQNDALIRAIREIVAGASNPA